MYKIKTPNSFYNGKTYGVEFKNGLGQTENEEVKNILINDFRYELIKDENKKSKQSSEKAGE